MRFESPWALSRLVLLVPILLRQVRRGGVPALSFSALRCVRAAGKSWRQRWIWLPRFLQTVALVCVGIALARPQYGVNHVQNLHRGIAIAMLLDVSSSMDLSIWSHQESGSRLETAKTVFEEFVVGNDRDLPGRTDDLIGMITFARYADTICPMTLGHDALVHFLHRVTIEDRPGEDGTAIGDALALGAARLQKAEDDLRRQAEQIASDFQIKSKAIILLTDGENNRGKYLPEQAAALAKKWGIRVYVIGFGDEREMQTVQTPQGPRRIPAALSADAKTLVQVAESTGGLFRMAHDAESLRAVCREIDRLETSEIQTRNQLEYRDWFDSFAAAAAAALFLESLLRSTWLRRIP